MGPSGKIGDKGKIVFLGPANSKEPIIFATYHTATKNGMLEISNITLVPKNATTFEIRDNYICLTENGFFEFTLSGMLFEEDKENNTTFILRTQHQSNYNNYINIRLANHEKRKYFISTKITRFSYLQDISLLLNKTDTSNAPLKEVVLIIRKFE